MILLFLVTYQYSINDQKMNRGLRVLCFPILRDLLGVVLLIAKEEDYSPDEA